MAKSLAARKKVSVTLIVNENVHLPAVTFLFLHVEGCAASAPRPSAPLSGLTEQPLGPRNQVKPPALYAHSATPPFTAFQSILLTAR